MPIELLICNIKFLLCQICQKSDDTAIIFCFCIFYIGVLLKCWTKNVKSKNFRKSRGYGCSAVVKVDRIYVDFP